MKGSAVHCFLCECSIPSSGRIEAHFKSKEHLDKIRLGEEEAEAEKKKEEEEEEEKKKAEEEKMDTEEKSAN